MHDAKHVNESVNRLWRQHAFSNNEKKRLKPVDKRVQLKRQRRRLASSGNLSLRLLLLLRRRRRHGDDHEPMDNSRFLQHAPRVQHHLLLSISLPSQEEGDGEKEWKLKLLLPLVAVVVEMRQLLPRIRLLSR